jgi:hypothetical protein
VIGVWKIDCPDLPEGISGATLLATTSRMYLLGGFTSSGITDKIYWANVYSNGTISEWSLDPIRLPTPLAYAQSVITGNKAYLIGGFNGTGYTKTTYMASVADPIIAGWTVAPDLLPGETGQGSVIVTSTKIYYLATLFNNRAMYVAPFSGGQNYYLGATYEVSPTNSGYFNVPSIASPYSNLAYYIKD